MIHLWKQSKNNWKTTFLAGVQFSLHNDPPELFLAGTKALPIKHSDTVTWFLLGVCGEFWRNDFVLWPDISNRQLGGWISVVWILWKFLRYGSCSALLMKALIIVSLMTLHKWTVYPTELIMFFGGSLRYYLKVEKHLHAYCHFNCALTAMYHACEDLAVVSGPLNTNKKLWMRPSILSLPSLGRSIDSYFAGPRWKVHQLKHFCKSTSFLKAKMPPSLPSDLKLLYQRFSLFINLHHRWAKCLKPLPRV